jgi:hypothetical protein
MTEAVFVAFGIVALAAFYFVVPAYAVAFACIAGWLLLPVGNFPVGSSEAVFPYWITGTAVPSSMLLTKMWWPPVVAFAGALLTDRRTLTRFRARWGDIPICLWCSWPLVQWAVIESPDPKPWISTLYLAATWGAPWFLGRIYFSGIEGSKRLMMCLVAGLTLIAPIALVEGIMGPRVYGWLYIPHPFRLDGAERYLGFRPLAFFEHGNQYGIWVAATALAAILLAVSLPTTKSRIWSIPVAILAILIAVASQSIGAIVLLFFGLTLSLTIPREALRWSLFSVFLLICVSGAIYLSGSLPFRVLAESTEVGRRIVDVFREIGRGSFVWRIARDQAALDFVKQHLLFGSGQWDWWRSSGERPWGLPLLIIGQYGLVGFACLSGSFLASCAISASNFNRFTVPLLSIVALALFDAMLNSFFFYPAILAGGALATANKIVEKRSHGRTFE